MSLMFRLMILTAGLGILAAAGTAQPPKKKPGEPPQGGPKGASIADTLVARLMAFDKNKDGKLTKEELTDIRLHALFDLADANKDGVVTREEIQALAATLEPALGQGGKQGEPGGPAEKGPGGPPGPGGPDGPGPGRFGPPPLGHILPPPVQEKLNLTAVQKRQLDALQKDVDGKLMKILTAQQLKQVRELRPGPGGPGGPPPGR